MASANPALIHPRRQRVVRFGSPALTFETCSRPEIVRRPKSRRRRQEVHGRAAMVALVADVSHR